MPSSARTLIEVSLLVEPRGMLFQTGHVTPSIGPAIVKTLDLLAKSNVKVFGTRSIEDLERLAEVKEKVPDLVSTKDELELFVAVEQLAEVQMKVRSTRMHRLRELKLGQLIACTDSKPMTQQPNGRFVQAHTARGSSIKDTGGSKNCLASNGGKATWLKWTNGHGN
ncbi:hypothetical protein HO133_007769 [Letharia lupina]|uniref:Uncharacterized protein n=1 Tax=Letharia lupina TaxID=560253 RepID=A0A8H6CRK5_9LECA|nr:uncharacterized protein HO133_007769 [Letharia lupina]KAF6228041.1 hypothetical protein HO133_007769 [Letharia lupina]